MSNDKIDSDGEKNLLLYEEVRSFRAAVKNADQGERRAVLSRITALLDTWPDAEEAALQLKRTAFVAGFHPDEWNYDGRGQLRVDAPALLYSKPIERSN